MSEGAVAYAAVANYRLQTRPGCRGAIVLLHGLGGDLEQLWGVTGAEVGGRPAAVLAADARGHGRTQLGDLGPLDFGVLAEDVLSLVDGLGLGPRLVLVGVSMGAATALAVALSSPERVHGLVLVRPAWLHEPRPENLAPLAEVAALLRRWGPVEGAAAFRASPTYRECQAVSPRAAASLVDQFGKPDALARVRRLEDLPGAVPYPHPERPGRGPGTHAGGRGARRPSAPGPHGAPAGRAGGREPAGPHHPAGPVARAQPRRPAGGSRWVHRRPAADQRSGDQTHRRSAHRR